MSMTIRTRLSALTLIVVGALSLSACFPDDTTTVVEPDAPLISTPGSESTVAAEPTPVLDAAGDAMTTALELTVKGRAPKTGYDRDEFGSGWVDVDRNGCDTRNDMLDLRMDNVVKEGDCKVMSGDLLDPFSGEWISFVRGDGASVDVDHLVALSDAWQKGAFQWEYEKRVAFANDPLNLEPVDAGLNRSKGDSDAATWLPPNKDFRCQYVARQVAVKAKYDVWVTQAEQDAIVEVLSACPGEPLPDAGSQPIIAENTGGPAPADEPEPAETEEPAADGDTDPNWGTCKEAKANGGGPYVRGVDPEYEFYRDGDGDGTVCE